jgi:hypothetical protein
VLQEANPHDLTNLLSAWWQKGLLLAFGAWIAWDKFGVMRRDHKTGEDRRVEEKTKGLRERAETAEHLAETRAQALKDREAELVLKDAEVARFKVQLQERTDGEVFLQSRVNTMRADLDELKRSVRELERG